MGHQINSEDLCQMLNLRLRVVGSLDKIKLRGYDLSFFCSEYMRLLVVLWIGSFSPKIKCLCCWESRARLSRICSDWSELRMVLRSSRECIFLLEAAPGAPVQWPPGQPRPASGDQRKGVRPGPVTSCSVASPASTAAPSLQQQQQQQQTQNVSHDASSPPYIISLIVVSELKYSFGIRILWNQNCRKSLNVLYSALFSVKFNSFWTVITSRNLAELLCTGRATVQITNMARVHCTAHCSPGTDHTCQLGAWPEKTVHWTDCVRPGQA